MEKEARIVAEYIEQVERARSRDGALKETDLHNIASELGLSEAELEQVTQIAQDHRTRGENFLSHGLLDDAISELRLAAGLQPLSAGVTLKLAEAHAARWQKEMRSADQNQAMTLARRSLAIDPESTEAYALLRRLKRPRVSGSLIAGVIAAGVLGALMIGGITVGWLIFRAPVEAPPVETPVVEAPAPVTPDAPRSLVKGALPVEVVPLSAVPGLTVEARESQLTEYNDATSYTQASLLHNDSGLLLSEVDLTLQLLDADGRIIHEKAMDGLETHNARVRPGDRHGFNTLVHLSPLPDGYATPAKAVVVITNAVGDPAAARYPEPREIPLSWAVEQPGELQLSLHERSSVFSPAGFSDETFHRGEYEIRSTPESGSLTMLKLQIEYLDASGAVVGTDHTYAVTGSEPAMHPGETRIFPFLESVEGTEPPASTRISVIEVR